MGCHYSEPNPSSICAILAREEFLKLLFGIIPKHLTRPKRSCEHSQLSIDYIHNNGEDFMKHLGLVILLVSLSACSVFSRHEDKRADKKDKTIEAPLADPDKHSDNYSMDERVQAENPEKPIDESKPLVDNIAAPTAEPIQDEVDVTLQKKSYLDQKYHEPKTDTLPAAATERTETTYSGKSSGVDPDKALGWLKNGNKRFLKGALRADGQSKKDIKRLAKSEKPHAVVFSSSDSRIPPEIIFDEKLGEIYVIRNLGLTVDSSTLNSIDYAIGDLGVRLVVILDRSYDAGMDFSHADETAQKLVDQSSVLKSAMESKNVKIVPAVYDIGTGKVTFGK